MADMTDAKRATNKWSRLIHVYTSMAALLLVLFALFVRPVGFDYRSKLQNPRWRASWDWALCTGAIVPSLVFGVAFGRDAAGWIKEAARAVASARSSCARVTQPSSRSTRSLATPASSR